MAETSYRILCMDGGGIYGLTTAVMLRRLCRRNEGFLDFKVIRKHYFAGTSAGALNALLLAQEENPRTAVLSGKLERFWAHPGIYTNQVNPFTAWLSFFGLTGWHGEADFVQLLKQTFGEHTKLKDLKHDVMISTFSMDGSPPAKGIYHWRPKIIYSFPEKEGEVEPDGELPVWQVAYWAASPPTMRSVRDGFADGGIFAPNPSDNALAKVVRVILGGDGIFTNQDKLDLNRLSRIVLFSLGVGRKPPRYQFRDFDFGMWPFMLWPTNFLQGEIFPPTVSLSLDAPGLYAQYKTKLFLGEQAFHLDPPLLAPPFFPPTLIATTLSRFDVYRNFFVSAITNLIESPEAQPYLDEAADFLEEHWKERDRKEPEEGIPRIQLDGFGLEAMHSSADVEARIKENQV
ncbi:MAG: patatin-like phospholipase family protein [Acidobacteriota bacterium]|nr:patatin-like phospholipase family protein [Acidobacteriota bacterium]